MNCGRCYFTTNTRTPLVNDRCPTCGADYSRATTEPEIQSAIASAKPIDHTAGYSIPPPKPKETTTAPTSNNKESKKSKSDVVSYLKEHKHTSKETAIGATQATKLFGAGIANALAKAGTIKVDGKRKGSVYWVDA